MINNVGTRMRKIKKIALWYSGCSGQLRSDKLHQGCTSLSGGHLVVTGVEIGEGEVLEMGGERTEYGQSDLTAVSTEEKCVMQIFPNYWCQEGNGLLLVCSVLK